MNPKFSIPRERIAAFCQKYGIRRFAIFGSALREDFCPDSDFDIDLDILWKTVQDGLPPL